MPTILETVVFQGVICDICGNEVLISESLSLASFRTLYRGISEMMAHINRYHPVQDVISGDEVLTSKPLFLTSFKEFQGLFGDDSAHK